MVVGNRAVGDDDDAAGRSSGAGDLAQPVAGYRDRAAELPFDVARPRCRSTAASSRRVSRSSGEAMCGSRPASMIIA